LLGPAAQSPGAGKTTNWVTGSPHLGWRKKDGAEKSATRRYITRQKPRPRKPDAYEPPGALGFRTWYSFAHLDAARCHTLVDRLGHPALPGALAHRQALLPVLAGGADEGLEEWMGG
jgi:hypothetical protein